MPPQQIAPPAVLHKLGVSVNLKFSLNFRGERLSLNTWSGPSAGGWDGLPEPHYGATSTDPLCCECTFYSKGLSLQSSGELGWRTQQAAHSADNQRRV